MLCLRIAEMCCRCVVRNANEATVNAGPCAPPDDWETIWVRCTLVAKGLYRNRSVNLFVMGQSRRLLVCALLRKWCRVCCLFFVIRAYCQPQRRTTRTPRSPAERLPPTSASVSMWRWRRWLLIGSHTFWWRCCRCCVGAGCWRVDFRSTLQDIYIHFRLGNTSNPRFDTVFKWWLHQN